MLCKGSWWKILAETRIGFAPWALAQILYKVPLKVTKGSADEHADYRVNVCMPGERLFTSLTVFSRLLVYLTSFFLFTSTLNKKKKAGRFLSSLIFFETAGILHPERRQISLPCQGWRWGGRDTHHHRWLS